MTPFARSRPSGVVLLCAGLQAMFRSVNEIFDGADVLKIFFFFFFEVQWLQFLETTIFFVKLTKRVNF